MMVMLMCFHFILIFNSLLLIGFPSIRHFSIPFLRITVTPLWCCSSSLPLYNTCLLCWFYTCLILSIFLANSKNVQVERLISVLTCAIFTLLSHTSAFTFQNPILVLVLALKTSIFRFHHCRSNEYLAMSLEAHHTQ